MEAAAVVVVAAVAVAVAAVAGEIVNAEEARISYLSSRVYRVSRDGRWSRNILRRVGKRIVLTHRRIEHKNKFVFPFFLRAFLFFRIFPKNDATPRSSAVKTFCYKRNTRRGRTEGAVLPSTLEIGRRKILLLGVRETWSVETIFGRRSSHGASSSRDNKNDPHVQTCFFFYCAGRLVKQSDEDTNDVTRTETNDGDEI